MKNVTQDKIFSAIEHLLQKKSIDDITVTEIVNQAQISRKTFYRNYQDKYDLVGQYFDYFFEETFGRIINGTDFDTAFIEYLTICEERSAILRHAYQSTDARGLRTFDIQLTKRTYETYLKECGADIDSKEMQFAIKIASYGGTDLVIEWLLNGMQEDKIEFKNNIKSTLPPILLRYLQ